MNRQRGWVGIVSILVALLVVAALAPTLLRHYGVTGPNAGTAASARQPGTAVSADGVEATPAGASGPTLRAPIEQARRVEEAVMKGAAEQARRIDEQTR